MYPDAERPEADAIELLATRERDFPFSRCLEKLGFTVADHGRSGNGFEPRSDGDSEAVSIGQFACEARYLYEGQLDYLMTVEQRSARLSTVDG